MDEKQSRKDTETAGWPWSHSLYPDLDPVRDKTKLTVLNYRLIDDLFARVALKDIPAVQLILRIILKMPDLRVISVKVQELPENGVNRSLWLDVLAEDETGRRFNVAERKRGLQPAADAAPCFDDGRHASGERRKLADSAGDLCYLRSRQRLSGRRSAVFASSSSVTVTFSMPARGISSEISGRLRPRSHLLMALSERNSRSARSFCVYPIFLRCVLINSPNFALSISNCVLSALLFFKSPFIILLFLVWLCNGSVCFILLLFCPSFCPIIFSPVLSVVIFFCYSLYLFCIVTLLTACDHPVGTA